MNAAVYAGVPGLRDCALGASANSSFSCSYILRSRARLYRLNSSLVKFQRRAPAGNSNAEVIPFRHGNGLHLESRGSRDDSKRRTIAQLARSKGGSALRTSKVKKTREEEEDEEDALAEAALEALFAQLEKDLEEGGMSEDDDDDEEFTEEEVIALEDELEAALLGLDYDQQTAIHAEANQSKGRRKNTESTKIEDKEVILDDEDDEEGDEDQRVVSLEPWQIKKLAAAAEIGRRHVNVKSLAAEVGMDRTDVLAWLKNPPPELLMLGATIGLEDDEGDEKSLQPHSGTPSKTSSSSYKKDKETQGFTPEMWHNQKRLRKEHIATFERVFRRTRRPTNSMIQNLVELTHVPRKRIVEWFDDKRQQVEPSQSFQALK